MSFPRYPTYKDSGVEWLGDVPGHWGVCSARWITRRYSGGTPDKTKLEYWEDGTIPWLNSGAVNDRLIIEPSTYITDEAFANSSAKWIPKGALLMALAGQGKTKGMVAQLGIPSTCNQSMAAIIPSREIEARFLFWWLDSNYQNIRNMAGGDLRDGLNLELLGNIKCPLPSPSEQTQITAFLDRETAKIDALVAEQRRLMVLLKEKRQAVISHAVTRGLNPHVPMKPSGIQWLGDVPEHWEVKKIKFVTENVKAGPFGSALTKDVYVSAGYRVYGQEQVIPNDFTLGDYFITPAKYDELSQYSVSPGDILISCVGTFGKIAIVPDNIEPGIINPRLIRLRCSYAIKAEYLVEVMRSNVTFEQFSSFTRGGTMDVINIGTLNEIYIALPPMDEQQVLLGFVLREIGKFDTLTTEAQRAIDLLQERRTALISAAVTGQIDVRGLNAGAAALPEATCV